MIATSLLHEYIRTHFAKAKRPVTAISDTEYAGIQAALSKEEGRLTLADYHGLLEGGFEVGVYFLPLAIRSAISGRTNYEEINGYACSFARWYYSELLSTSVWYKLIPAIEELFFSCINVYGFDTMRYDLLGPHSAERQSVIHASSRDAMLEDYMNILSGQTKGSLFGLIWDHMLIVSPSAARSAHFIDIMVGIGSRAASTYTHLYRNAAIIDAWQDRKLIERHWLNAKSLIEKEAPREYVVEICDTFGVK